MFGRGYNFLKRTGLGLATGIGLGTVLFFGSADEANAQDVDLSDLVDDVFRTKQTPEESTPSVKTENQRRFSEVYDEMDSKSGLQYGYFAEARVKGSTNRETEYDSFRGSIEIGKFLWGDSKWNGRVKFEYNDTDGREEFFEISGGADYRLSDALTAGFKAFGGDHSIGGEGRIRLTIDLGSYFKDATATVFGRAGGSNRDDRIRSITHSLIDSDQEIRDGYGEIGLKVTTKNGSYFTISDIYKWIHSEMWANMPTSADADIEVGTNALIASLGHKAKDYSVDFTGIWTHTRTNNKLKVADAIDESELLRGQATGFYHLRGKGHSVGLMVGGDKNGWDVRGIYIFQDNKSASIAKELEKLKTETDAISKEEIQNRLEKLSLVSALVHKVEVGGRRSEVSGARSWEAFAGYELTLSMNSKFVKQFNLDFELTYGELYPTYGSHRGYFRGRANAEARFGKGWYLLGGANGNSYEGQKPSWNFEGGFGKRF